VTSRVFDVRPADLAWRCWDGECVVHDERTGLTHHLVSPASDVLLALVRLGPLSMKGLWEAVFADSDEATLPDTAAQAALVELLSQLQALEVVEASEA
jgi:PqqD family protein of HPr-rel-A system